MSDLNDLFGYIPQITSLIKYKKYEEAQSLIKAETRKLQQIEVDSFRIKIDEINWAIVQLKLQTQLFEAEIDALKREMEDVNLDIGIKSMESYLNELRRYKIKLEGRKKVMILKRY